MEIHWLEVRISSLTAMRERGTSHRVLRVPKMLPLLLRSRVPWRQFVLKQKTSCTQDFFLLLLMMSHGKSSHSRTINFLYLCTESSHTKVVLRKFLVAILNPDIRNVDFSYTCSNIALFLLCELQAAPNLKFLKSGYTKNITRHFSGRTFITSEGSYLHKIF